MNKDVAQLDKIDELRLKLIKKHAHLEMIMCEIFQHLSGCNDDAGNLIFFSMDYRRYDVVKELIDNKHPHFRNAYKAIHEQIKYLNSKRNKIVHWTQWHDENGEYQLADPRLASNLDYFFNTKIRLKTDDLESCLCDFKQIIDVLLAFWNCFPIYDDGTQPDKYLVSIFQDKYKNISEIDSALEIYYITDH